MSSLAFHSILAFLLPLLSLGKECHKQFSSNPLDCGSFILCNFGQEIVMRCGEGLHWNPRINACDWARNARCLVHQDIGLRPQGSNFIDEEELYDRDADCNDNAFKPHPTNCGKYFVCDHGSWKEMSCGSPLQWNPTHSTCDWPSNVNCEGDKPIGPPSGTSRPPGWTSAGHPAPPPPPPPDGEVEPPAPPPTSPPTTSAKPTKPPTSTTPSSSSAYETDPTIVGIITGPPTPKPQDSDPNNPSPAYFVICYFTGWSWYRPGDGKFGPQHVNPDLCSHIVYAFAILDYSTSKIKPADSWLDIDNRFYKQMTQLKNQGKKVTIALGGWNDSEGQKYSLMLKDPTKIKSLIDSVAKFMDDYGFDGIDLDYEYPVCPHGECKTEMESDRDGFSRLVKGLRESLPKGSIISAAVSANKDIIDRAYDIPVLSKYLDWVGVMSYDMHGSWEKQTGHIAPLYYHPDDTKDYFNANYSIHHWIDGGAEPGKLVMGVPFYGQAFTLQDPTSSKNLNAPARGPGQPGEYSRQGGILSYYEICSRKWDSKVNDEEGRMGPYLIQGDQWVSYDDEDFIKRKMNYIKSMGLGGAMVWALDFDDFSNKCGTGDYPLLRAVNEMLIHT